jgi:peroxiredoxin
MGNQTSRELDQARKYYREERIPKAALSVMDADTERLTAEKFADRALQPGAVAPDFILPDAQGKLVWCHSLLRNGPAVVVFYRGGWCPYCNIHLRGFQRSLPELKALGAQIVAISPQVPDNSLSTQEKDELEYPVLSDVGNKVAHKFGVAFRLSDPLLKLYESFGHPLLEANGKEGEFELPVPATFVIDTKGVIRRSHVDVDYTHRLDPEDVIIAIKKLTN